MRSSGDGGSTVTNVADPRVDAYIDAVPDWQQASCREVRDLVHSVDRDVAETVKRARQPYFVSQGNICALLAAKDHVNVFLYDGGIVSDSDGIITGGHHNKTARTLGVLAVGATQARWLGHRLVADLAITVDESLPVRQGHEIAEQVRHRLLHEVRHLDDANVHVDPAGTDPHQLTGHHRNS